MYLYQTLIIGLYELPEVVVVDENKNFVFAAFYIIVLNLSGFNNCQKLLIMTLTTNFCGNYFSKKKSIRCYLSIFDKKESEWFF